MVVSRITKPQKVKKWASPGIGRLSSLRWPKTSTSSARRRGPAGSKRLGGGRPVDPLGPLPGRGDGEEGEHESDGELHRTSSWPGRVRWPCGSLPLGNIRRRIGWAESDAKRDTAADGAAEACPPGSAGRRPGAGRGRGGR